jgi:hypothetical protein
MEKYYKPIIIVIILISTFFLIRSRRVSKSDFELLVLLEQTDVMEVCHNRLIAKQNNPNINFVKVNYDDKLYYNYTISIHGVELCNDKERLKKVIEDHYKEFLKNEWKFVF